jgi:CDP-diacylglycerol pyrophosphatase
LTAFCSLLALTCALRPAAAFEGRAFGRDGLWRVVHDVCAPVSRITGVSLPCLAVDHDKGFATLRAPDETTHIIVTPLQRIAGVESPALLRPDAPNYWADAWSQRGAVAGGAGRPLAWGELGMAINSRLGRSQDQLHIHVDCVKPEVRQALARAIHGQKGWFDLDLRPWGGPYRTKRLRADDLDRNIFRMVATEIPRAGDNMAHETIALIGFEDARSGRGFILLAAGDGGHAEELLDHQCRVARE